MRSLPIVLVALAAFLAPTAALASGSATAPPSRSFVITALVLGDVRIDASGKLSIEGGHLVASVGCNTIGGTVTFDGDTVTIPQPLVMTEMACPGMDGRAEALLVKILQAGPFTIEHGAWRAAAAAILVDELPVGPGPAGTPLPPDGVVSSSPGPGLIGPTVSCPPAPIGTNATTPIEVGPGSGTGGGATGSGASSGSGSAPAAGETRPAGSETAPGQGESVPAATAIDLPMATAASEVSTAGPGPTVGPAPGSGKAGDGSPCAERMTAVGGADGGGIEAPEAADAAAPHVAVVPDAALIVPIGVVLVVTLLAGILAFRHGRSARRSIPPDDGTTAPG